MPSPSSKQHKPPAQKTAWQRSMEAKEQARIFLHGNDVPLPNRSYEILNRLARARYNLEARKNRSNVEFTHEEQAQIHNAHLWVILGLEPHLKKEQINERLRNEKTVTRAPLPWDIGVEIDAARKGKNKDDLYGTLFMVPGMDEANIRNHLPKGPLKKYNGFAFRGESVLKKKKDLFEFGATAAHEFAHRRYLLDEPLCHAITYAYGYGNGLYTLKELSEMHNKVFEKEHIKGLEIVIESARRGGNRWNDFFWKEIRTLARKKMYQWQ